MTAGMPVWVVDHPGPIDEGPLRRTDRPVPVPGADEILVRVEACGVCRTDLHLAEGDLAPRRPRVVPGHQIVGRVVRSGSATTRFEIGDRVGVAWLRRTCGECRWCRGGSENLCPGSAYTGWDADGGLAEYATAPAAYAYRLPADLAAAQAAPLLCAGIIGYRALQRCRLPPGGRLGIYGFGSSAHLSAQVALASGAELSVMTRGEAARELARAIGASFVGHSRERPPRPLDAAIVFAPAGDLVPPALAAVERGGCVVLAGIHMSDVPVLNYQHHLFGERDLRSVAANTRRDGEEFLALAGRLRVQAHVRTYPFDRADAALRDLAHGAFSGSAVVTLD